MYSYVSLKTIAQDKLHNHEYIPIISKYSKNKNVDLKKPVIYEMPLDKEVAFSLGLFLSKEK